MPTIADTFDRNSLHRWYCWWRCSKSARNRVRDKSSYPKLWGSRNSVSWVWNTWRHLLFLCIQDKELVARALVPGCKGCNIWTHHFALQIRTTEQQQSSGCWWIRRLSMGKTNIWSLSTGTGSRIVSSSLEGILTQRSFFLICRWILWLGSRKSQGNGCPIKRNSHNLSSW